MLGSLIGAGSSIIGGILGRKNAKKQSQREYERQKEFAQHGIRWKAADAEAAGISKLYALGANTTSYSPQSVGGSDYGISQAGQNIGRAIEATQSGSQRQQKMAHQLAQVQLQGLELDNDIKRAKLASATRLAAQPGTPPAHNSFETTPHVPGQGNSTLVDVRKKIAPAGHSPEASYGVHPEVDWYRTSKGYVPQIPQDLAESMEQNWAASAMWQLRNSLGPYVGLQTSTPPAKKGYYLHFHPIYGYQYKKLPNNRYRMRIPRKGR
jgi:hypothetical protein